MDDHRHDNMIPKGGLKAATALVLFSLAAVIMVRVTGVGEVRMSVPAAVESRDLQFADGDGGAILVYDAASGKLVETLPPNSNGFVRVVLRGMARDRRSIDVGHEPPFRLTRHVNGQVTLLDTSTSKQIDLGAFGSTNAASFSRLMKAQG